MKKSLLLTLALLLTSIAGTAEGYGKVLPSSNDVLSNMTFSATDEELPQLPPPMIYSHMENSIFYIYVVGEGDLHLLVNGEEVDGTSISIHLQQDVEMEYVCQAYASGPGYLDSEYVTATFLVPMEFHGPYLYKNIDDDYVSIMIESEADMTVYIDGVEDTGWDNVGNYHNSFQRLDHDYIVTITVYAYMSGHADVEKTFEIEVPAKVVTEGYDFEENGIYYLITAENKVSVSFKDKNYNTYSGTVSIPKTVTHDGETYLVTGIRENAFKGCTDLTAVNIGDYVTYIGNSAFEGCRGLEDVVIGDYVISIADSAFYLCTALKSITLGSGLRTLGASVFGRCNSLTTVNCKAATPPTIESYSCFESYTRKTLHVYPPVHESYTTANYWSIFGSTVSDISLAPAPGDVNGDGTISISDVTGLITRLLSGF